MVAVGPDDGQGTGASETAGDEPTKRRYESPLRDQQAAATRERIVTAAAEMVHGFPDWDWRELTVRAVARRAGVNESTIYRHFSTERNLHDAVLRRLETEAGVEVEGLGLEDYAETIAQTFAYLSSFPITRQPTKDPTFAALDERRRAALRAAVADAAGNWSDDEVEMAAATLDVFWNVPAFERMITAWNLDAQKATHAVTWVIGLIEAAVRDGQSPDGPA